MKIEGDGTLLRIFLGEDERYHGKALYERVVILARDRGMAGATVLRGTLGFGASSRIHSARVLRLSENLPVVIEIVDLSDRVLAFEREVESLFEESGCGGLITREAVEIVRYVSSKG